MRSLPLLIAACTAAVVGSSACSSSSGASDAGNEFGGGDSGSSSSSKSDAKSSSSSQHDGGTSSAKKDAGPTSTTCGVPVGTDWCSANAPAGSFVQCDDFDDGILDTIYNWPGILMENLVNDHTVSPNCAMTTPTAGAAYGAYTEHPNTDAPSTAAGTLAFHLFIPSGTSCEGAVVGRFLAEGGLEQTAGEVQEDAVKVWVTVSNITGSGTSATSYQLTLSAGVGEMGDATFAGTAVTVAPITVTPQASDDGWALISLDISKYTVATAASVAGTVGWSYVTSKTAKGTSSSVSATGTLMNPSGATQAFFDVGVAPDPTNRTAVIGCALYVDNVLSNLTTPM